jgi:hypothetical protein
MPTASMDRLLFVGVVSDRHSAPLAKDTSEGTLKLRPTYWQLAIGILVRPHTKSSSLPRFTAVQNLQRKQDLTRLAPKRGFVAA